MEKINIEATTFVICDTPPRIHASMICLCLDYPVHFDFGKLHVHRTFGERTYAWITVGEIMGQSYSILLTF